MNISGLWGGIPQNSIFSANMLKSTREKTERKQECDSKVAFYENRIVALKDMDGDSLEEIAHKLELLHSYEDYIAAAKHEYNNQQMFHAMDEARERGEEIAEAAKEHETKTAEERKREAVEEALGTESGGVLTGMLEELEERTEQAAEQTELEEEQMEQAEEQVEQAGFYQ